MKKELTHLIGKKLVLDTASNWVYIGVLETVTDHCAVLAEADVHDSSDTHTSKELYIFDSKTTGVKANRKLTHINLDYVVSFSLFEDIKEF